LFDDFEATRRIESPAGSRRFGCASGLPAGSQDYLIFRVVGVG